MAGEAANLLPFWEDLVPVPSYVKPTLHPSKIGEILLHGKPYDSRNMIAAATSSPWAKHVKGAPSGTLKRLKEAVQDGAPGGSTSSALPPKKRQAAVEAVAVEAAVEADEGSPSNAGSGEGSTLAGRSRGR